MRSSRAAYSLAGLLHTCLCVIRATCWGMIGCMSTKKVDSLWVWKTRMWSECARCIGWIFLFFQKWWKKTAHSCNIRLACWGFKKSTKPKIPGNGIISETYKFENQVMEQLCRNFASSRSRKPHERGIWPLVPWIAWRQAVSEIRWCAKSPGHAAWNRHRLRLVPADVICQEQQQLRVRRVKGRMNIRQLTTWHCQWQVGSLIFEHRQNNNAVNAKSCTATAPWGSLEIGSASSQLACICERWGRCLPHWLGLRRSIRAPSINTCINP